MKITSDNLLEIEVIVPMAHNVKKMRSQFITLPRKDILSVYSEFNNRNKEDVYFVRVTGTVKPQENKRFEAVIVSTYQMNESEYMELKKYLLENPRDLSLPSSKVMPKIHIVNVTGEMEPESI